MSMLLLTMGPNLSIMADIPAVGVGSPGVIRFRPIGASGPVKWTLVDSTLPAEWDSALNPDGNAVTLTTADAETAGTFSVTVRAVDNARIPVARSFDVRVIALPLTISGTFPEWEVGQPVSGSLTIIGGVPPYGGLAITAGALPDGVSLSIVGNQIVPSGAPTVAGPWSAAVQVSDSVSAAALITLNGDVVEHTSVYAQWDPTYLTTGGAIVNSGRDLVSTTSVGYRSTRSTIPLSGNVYFSLYANRGTANNWGLGVVDSGTDLVPSSSWVGFGGSAGWWEEGRIYMGGSPIHTPGSTPIVEVAARVATRRFWMRNSGGAWIGGGDPVSDTSPTFVLPGAGAIYAAASLHVTGGFGGALARICAHPDDVTGTTPSGFVRGIFT